jgi:uncharacterized protein (TIGR01319 family)
LPEKIGILTVEVGSTITKVNGFAHQPGGRLVHIGQGFAPTSISQGDVRIGVDQAMAQLRGGKPVFEENVETFVNSSAAGGLRMTVHGLTYNMTARAAREAALGAGAIVKKVTAGLLDQYELEEIREIRPNIILLAGGVDFGERATVLENARQIASLGLPVPVVYAGNSALRKPIAQLFQAAGIECLQAENVFPEVDVLNIQPLRRVIHEVFNRHIIHAPGMNRLAEITSKEILPTPGAVLRASELLADVYGDCLVFDVGGATTDVHSVTDGSPEWTHKLVEPEPRAKRTVEGDLGVFINARNIIEITGNWEQEDQLVFLQSLPITDDEIELTHWLCGKAVELSVRRHAGVISELYTPTGKKQIVKGKDLTAVKWVIGTGGALTRVQGGKEILAKICTGPGRHLLPQPGTPIRLDSNYLFSALGTVAQSYPDEVKLTFEHWLENET